MRANKWGWLGVKRFRPEECPDLESRYAALEKHHAAETTALIDLVRRLCEHVEKSP